jgi:hypothetical protein
MNFSAFVGTIINSGTVDVFFSANGNAALSVTGNIVNSGVIALPPQTSPQPSTLVPKLPSDFGWVWQHQYADQRKQHDRGLRLDRPFRRWSDGFEQQGSD